MGRSWALSIQWLFYSFIHTTFKTKGVRKKMMNAKQIYSMQLKCVCVCVFCLFFEHDSGLWCWRFVLFTYFYKHLRCGMTIIGMNAYGSKHSEKKTPFFIATFLPFYYLILPGAGWQIREHFEGKKKCFMCGDTSPKTFFFSLLRLCQSIRSHHRWQMRNSSN